MAGWQKFKQQAVKQEDHFKRKAGRRWILFVGMVFALLCSAGAARVQATPTVTVDSVTILRAPTTTEIPLMRSTGADVDGTFNTIFRVHYTITPATNTAITGASIKLIRGVPNDQTFSLPATSGAGTFDIAGYFLVNQNASKTSNTFWGGSYTRTVQVSATSNETTNNSASATSPSIVVGPSGREVLIPLDSNNQPDLFRPHSGGLTVTPADGANDDDGTSSSTYTFRVLYRHPDGLPPLAVYNSRVDPWRFPIAPDVTLPSGVNTPSVTTGIGLYFDDNAAQDCNEIADPQNPGHVLGRQLNIDYVVNGYIPVMHFMVPETNNNPTAADYKNGVVYIYRMIPTSHEVAVGMPGNFYSRVSFLQSLVAQFGQLFGFRGLRYIDGDKRLDQFSNNRLTSGTNRQDPRYSAPFLALAAGPHAYTFRCTSDPTVAGYDANTNLVSAVYRYPDYNAPALGGTSNQPALVFPEPNKTTGMQFDKPTVNPALDTDVATAPDSPANYPIRIATPLTIPNPLRQGVSPANQPEVLLVNATRALSAETVRFRVYYRQSDNVAPLSVTLLLFAKSGSGFSTTPTQMEAMLEEAPGTYATGKAFYRDIQLPPGEYRYYFRANDGTRTAEWPGDSQAGTSLTANLNVSHMANTLRVNRPPVLSAPQVTPAFGNTGTGFTYQVTYTDADNDPPLFARLYIGTHQPDPITAVTDLGTVNSVHQVRLTVTRNIYQPDTYINGEVALGAIKDHSFPITDNDGNSFTVADPDNVLNATVVNDVLYVRRRVDMKPVPPTDTDYTNGVVYQFNTASDSTLKLEEGTRSYHFEFTDNWQTPEDPEPGETVRYYAGTNNEIQGPVIQDNKPPILSLGKVSQPNDSVAPIEGTTATLFTYNVRYTDPDNNAPSQMQVIIDPKESGTTGPYTAVTLSERIITVTGTSWKDNQWAGKVVKLGTNPVHWYVVASNTANALTLVPGTNLKTDGFAEGASFQITDITGDVKAMTQTNPADTLYTDGADYQVTTRLGEGIHTFLFRTSDGFTTLYDSTQNGTPFTAISGPQVNANSVPSLFPAQVVDDGVGATITAIGSSSITLGGRTYNANEQAGRVLQVRRGPAVIATFLITGNTADTLTLSGNPAAAGVQPTDTFRIGAEPMTPVAGPAGTTFTWKVVYTDPDNDSPETGAPAFIHLVIDGKPQTMTKVDPTDSNYTDGALYQFQTNSAALVGSGAHSYYFEANDGANATRLLPTGDFGGPAVNNAPVLSGGTVSPASGKNALSSATYRYEVIYTDSDNDAPDAGMPFVELDGDAAKRFPMTKVDPTDSNCTDGVLYRYDYAGGFPAGAHTFRFFASSSGAGRSQQATPLSVNGPWVNNVPTLEGAQVAPTSGSPKAQYTFQVTYKDPDNNAPAGNKLTITIKKPDNATLGSYDMVPAANAGTDYKGAGVVYTYTTPASGAGQLTAPGTYSYSIAASDAVTAPIVSQSAVTVTGSGPTINTVPTITALAVAPSQDKPGTSFTFTAKYTDADDQAPVDNKLKLFIYKPDGNLLAAAGQDMPPVDATSIQTGRSYTATVSLTDRGIYKFYVQGSDNVDTVIAPAGADTDTTKAQVGPTIYRVPVLSNDSFTPAGGKLGTSFTWKVTYADADGQAPAAGYPRLVVTDPTNNVLKDAANGDATYFAMTKQNTADNNYTGGVVYTYTLALPASGLYRYHFEASDTGGDDARLPDTAEKDGPTVFVAPTLASGMVTPLNGKSGTGFTWKVTYKDGDNQAPANGYPRVVITDPNGTVLKDTSGNAFFTMAKENAGDADYKNAGVVYTFARPLTVSGNYKYRFEVTDAGGDTAAFPVTGDLNGPTVFTPPTLSSGTVSPHRAQIGSQFTWTVNYADVDSQAPVAGYPRVVVTDPSGNVLRDPNGNAYFVMSKTSGDNSSATYSYTGTLSASGAYQYHFEVTDEGGDSARFPANGELNDLTAYNTPPTLSAMSVVPEKGTPGQNFTFLATYQDVDGDAPFDETGDRVPDYPKVVILGSAGNTVATVKMTPVNPADTAYRNGVAYQAVVNTLAGPDVYRYYFLARDGATLVALPTGADGDYKQALVGPTVNRQPALSSDTLSPAAGGLDTNYIFEVKYADPDGNDPAAATGLVNAPAGLTKPGVYVELTDAANNVKVYPMAATGNTFAAGVVYRFQSAVGIGSMQPGNYKYRFLAWDGINAAVLPDSGTKAGPAVNSTNPATLTNPTVSPAAGYRDTTFTYTVKYTDLDNQAPTAVKLFIDGKEATPAPTRQDATPFSQGTVYSYTAPAGALAVGTHTYHWEVTDGTTVVRLPADGSELTGPVVNNNAPTLSNVAVAAVSPTTGRAATEFVFRVTYTDNDNEPPTGGVVTLLLDGQNYTMTQEDSNDKNYKDGAVFVYRQVGLSEGSHSYQFTASDGFDSVSTSAGTGPTVNYAPVLSEASANPLVADPGAGITFTVKYQDSDGDLPTSIRVLVHRASDDTEVAGYTLLPAGGTPSAAQIRNGAYYQAVVRDLPLGVYRHFFTAGDGKDAVVLKDTGDQLFVGPTVNTAPVLTLLPSDTGVTPTAGDATQGSFTFHVRYSQGSNQAPRYVKLYVDNKPAVDMAPVTGTLDYRSGVVYQKVLTGPELGAGRHTFRFEAADPIQVCYLDQSGLTYDARPSDAVMFSGPQVNNAAVLSGVHIEALSAQDPKVTRPVYPIAGGFALPTERVRYTVLYADPDNDRPSDIRLYLDNDPTALPLVDTGTDAAGNANTTDTQRWSKGVVYTFTTPAALKSGSHQFRFVANDGLADTTLASDAATAAPAVQTLINPQVTPNGGGAGRDYNFTVSYVSFLGALEPDHLQRLQVQVKITQPSGQVLTVPMATDPAGDPTKGVLFAKAVKLTELGDHSFQIEANDGRFTYKTTSLALPRVAGPVLSTPSVTPTQAIVGKGFEFSVLYKHSGGQPAQSVRLYLHKQDGSLVDAAGYVMTTTDTDTNQLETNGWTYRTVVPLNEAGNYSFSVTASDGSEEAKAPADGSTIAGPVVTPPTLTEAGVSTTNGGYAGGIFTFKVKYTNGASVAPQFVRLCLKKPDGTMAQPVNLVPDSTGDYISGKVFTKSISLQTPGSYDYYFEASNDGSTICAKSETVTGLAVAQPEKPTLTEVQVTPAATGENRYTYQVVYKQTQGLKASQMRLYLDLDATSGRAAQMIDMLDSGKDATGAANATDPQRWSNGVVFLYTMDAPLAAGRHNFQIRASDGTDEVVTPLTDGPNINRAPTLEPQAVSPANGDENTLFTFTVRYTDPDNDPAASVKVMVGNTWFELKQADTNDTNYADGALYTAKVKLPAGDLGHSFLASDGTVTVRYPTTGVEPGPKVLPASQLVMSLSRTEMTLDGMSSVTVSGTLAPAAANLPVKLSFSRAGATDEVHATQDVTTDSEGRFSYTYLPDQDGSWSVRAEFSGDAQHGSGNATASFTVAPAQHTLSAALQMLGLPMAAGDLRTVISGGSFKTAVYTGNATTPYQFGPEPPFPAVTPGMGFWLLSETPLQVTLSGKIVDPTHDYAIAVRKGWNLIGNPYLQPTSWASARFRSGMRSMPLAQARTEGLAYEHGWVYNGSENEYQLLHATIDGAVRTLQPWQSAWFYSLSDGELVLAAPNTRSAEPEAMAREKANDLQWSIRLQASNGKQRDSFNIAGVTSDGRAADDGLMSPPMMKNYLDLYFTRNGQTGRYATDYHTASAGEQVWEFVVDTDVANKPVTVSAPNLASVPKNLEVLLEDVDAGSRGVYLRTAGGYTFNPGQSGQRRFRLVVRPRSEGTLQVSNIQVTTSRGGNAIGYALSQDAAVTVEVMSPSGKRLKLVADRITSTQGRASVVWDGTREDGVRLPSGIYLIQLTATTVDGKTARATKPIVITR